MCVCAVCDASKLTAFVPSITNSCDDKPLNMVAPKLLLPLFATLAVATDLTDPTVLIVVLARNKAHTLPHFLGLLHSLDYPRNRIILSALIYCLCTSKFLWGQKCAQSIILCSKLEDMHTCTQYIRAHFCPLLNIIAHML